MTSRGRIYRPTRIGAELTDAIDSLRRNQAEQAEQSVASILAISALWQEDQRRLAELTELLCRLVAGLDELARSNWIAKDYLGKLPALDEARALIEGMKER